MPNKLQSYRVLSTQYDNAFVVYDFELEEFREKRLKRRGAQLEISKPAKPVLHITY